MLALAAVFSLAIAGSPTVAHGQWFGSVRPARRASHRRVLPNVRMSGELPEITCEQLAVFRKARELERRDAEIVFLTYPALSEEAGRKLPKPVERSVLSDLTLRYLEGREKNRRWAEEKVRQDPDSPALYLFTRWWEAVRDTHEARRMVTLTMDQPEEAFWEAVALYDAAREEEHARFYAVKDSCQLT